MTAAAEVEDAPLRKSTILRFYLPLAASWLMMSVETPVCVGAISRLPEPTLNTAAFFLMMGLSLWIESPVMDLLSTSTTLAKDRAGFLALRRYTLWICGVVTVVHAAVAVTPLFDMLAHGLLGVPREVVDAARTAMIVMIPWSAFIGWRRFLQGVCIRHGLTRQVGFGTGVRLITVTGTALLFYFATDWPGVVVAATALVISVGVEAAFIHAVSAPIVRRSYPVSDEPPADIPWRRLANFHLPLTTSTILMLSGNPIIAKALAGTSEPIANMASWQVAAALVFLFRTAAFALPEVVITLHKGPKSEQSLKDFCILVGLFCAVCLAFFAFTGLDKIYFTNVIGAEPSEVQMAHIAVLWCLAMPFINAMMSFVRGMLTAYHLTMARLQAVTSSLIVFVLTLWLGVRLGWPGVALPAIALTVSNAAELVFLAYSWRVGKRATA